MKRKRKKKSKTMIDKNIANYIMGCIESLDCKLCKYIDCVSLQNKIKKPPEPNVIDSTAVLVENQ